MSCLECDCGEDGIILEREVLDGGALCHTA